MPRYFKRSIIGISLGLIAALILLFALRNPIAGYIFHKLATKTQNRYGISISTGALRIKGISTIELKGVLVKSTDTLFVSDYIEVKLNPLYLIALKINPKYISLSNTSVKVDKILLHLNSLKGTPSVKPLKSDKSGNKRIYRSIKNFFGLSTSNFQLENLILSYSDSSYTGLIKLNEWHYSHGRFNSKALLIDGSDTSRITIRGETSRIRNSVYAEVVPIGNDARVPFLQPTLGFSLSLKKAGISLIANQLNPNEIDITLASSFENITLSGKRIASTPVSVKSTDINLAVKIQPHRYTIDSTSWITMNNFRADVWAQYSTIPDARLTLGVQIPKSPWQSLFDALPEGLFTNLLGCRIKGTFSYSLRAEIPLNQPDSLTLQPKLSSSGFGMVSFGKTNLFALTDTFTHRAYNHSGFVRNIHIGPSNKRFTPLNQISPYLQWAVITSEDGGFYHHRGFSLEGITYAMACNIREKRFVRGGSTISQQLVKNLFLTQDKNIGRKAEEILITWIIENSGLVCKERLLEIYLNIIEWGPNIFGIHEASEYYFNKHPRELTLAESLFLAYIIPRPTKFRYLFDTEGNLKQFVIDNSRFVANKMLGRGNITPEDFEEFVESPNVKLVGKAKDLLRASASGEVEEITEDDLIADPDV